MVSQRHLDHVSIPRQAQNHLGNQKYALRLLFDYPGKPYSSLKVTSNKAVTGFGVGKIYPSGAVPGS